MVETAKSWLKENQTLLYFLMAQLIAIGVGGASMLAYFTTLEQRVTTLEVRGSPHLAEINNRLTTTEKETESNAHRIDRVVEIMTRELGKTVPPR
jgi:uncharacterized coiled-coil protein SlyX